MRWRQDKFYCSPTPKIIILGVGASLAALSVIMIETVGDRLLRTFGKSGGFDLSKYFYILLVFAALIFTIAVVEYVTRTDTRAIRYLIIRRLCAYKMGNPLGLKDGEIEPKIAVIKTGQGYNVRIESVASKFEAVSKLESAISDALRGKYGDYAVVAKSEDIAGRYVDYCVENVVARLNNQSVYRLVDDIPSGGAGRLSICDGVGIDYSRVLNSSALVVGGTRSGKTTAIVSVFLLPVLKGGPDKYGSRIVIIDPKSAELSQCEHVLSPDINGNVEHILEAIRDFNQTRIKRQQYINDLGRQRGKAVKWFDADMKPCLLFIDEWVSLQDLLPKKGTKENPDYCLSEFQGLIRQIATQGASAGCFLIISTAQASVGVGGLESVVNNACGIRIMFKPKKDEASFVWSSKQLETMKEWDFSAGDAWFSADDGIHNQVSFVKFPRLDDGFDEYKALSDLLKVYYQSGASCASKDAPDS